MLDRTKAPSFGKISKIEIPPAISHQLDNGTPIHSISAGSQAVVKLELIFSCGKWYETSDGLSFLTTKMLSEGTTSMSSLQISRSFDQYGAFLELNPGFDYVSVNVYTLNKYLDQLLPVLYDLVFQSVFPLNELNILKNNTIQDIKVKNEKNNVIAVKKFREAVFSDKYPYGKDLTEQGINQAGPSQLKNFYRQVFHNKMEMVVSGLVDQDMIKQINAIFGKVPRHDYPEPIHQTKVDFQRQIVVEKPKSSQSSVRIGKRLFNKNHPDYLKMLMVNEILGGYFGSRLMKNIREEKGYTYGIFSRIMNFKRAGYFVIGTDVNKEYTGNTIEQVNLEIKRLQDDLVGPNELETVRNQLIGSFLTEITSPFALADKFKAVYFHDLDYSFYQDFIKTVNTISAQEIRDMAQKYLDLNTMTEIVVGGIL
ncbi:MAG: M16 family metallopeptidase [Candidatus Cyclobacteriaceae bacterium M3_2C_046]